MTPASEAPSTSATDRATSAASSGSTRPSTTSPGSPTSRCTRCSTAGRSPPASPRPTAAATSSPSATLGLVNQVFKRARPARAGRRPRDRPRPLLDDRLQRVGELPAGPPLGGPAATAASSRSPTTATSSTPSSCTPSCASAGVDVPLDVGLRDHRRAARHAPGRATIEDAIADVMPRLQGAFSTVVMTQRRASSPSATRPACGRSSLGQLGDRYCVASESCALDIIGAELLRDVAARRDGLARRGRHPARARSSRATREAFCVFEYIYFARPGLAAWAATCCRPRAAGWARSSRARRRRRAPTS